jgi:hypothetical protein
MAASRGAAGGEATVRFSPTDGLPEGPAGSAAVVEVRPEGLRVHRPVAWGLRILPALASEPFPEAEALMGRMPQLYWHREWLLRGGVPLFVLAEVRGSRGASQGGSTVALRKPAKGPHIISTRSATSLRRRTAASVFGGLTIAVLAAVAGATALIVHFV